MVEEQAQEPGSPQAEDLAQVLFTTAGEALLIIEPQSERVLDANPMAQRLTGLPRDHLLRLSLREVVCHEQGARDWLDTVRHTGTFNGPDHFQLCTSRPKAWIPVSLTVSRLPPSGLAPLALVAIRDRREEMEVFRRLRRTQAEVRRVAAELRRVLVSASECFWSCRVDTSGRWRHRYLSPVVERITGRPVAFFLDNPAAWVEVVVPEDLPRWGEHLARVTAGEGGQIEFRIQKADGTTAWLWEGVTVAAPAPAPPGEGKGEGDAPGFLLHGVLRDVTRHKQADLERRHLEAHKQETLSVLAGGIAHTFNNLLTSILGNTDLARMAFPADSPLRRPLDQIESAALRAAGLCKQMIAFAGKGRFRIEPLDLNTLLRESSESLMLLAPGKATLTLELAPQLPLVLADAEPVSQVVRNLVMNALEAMGDEGGQIRIATGAVRLDRATPGPGPLAADLPEGDYVVLEVSDNGAGMTPEVQAQIFEPFFTTRFLGRGLGLAAVLGIVRHHRGAIRVESEPGRGTTFKVLLPCSPGPGGPAPLPPATPLPADEGRGAGGPIGKGGETVLIADDDEAVREAIAQYLEATGFRVVRAVDGLDALERFRELAGAVRLVLLDVTMPRLDGEQTLRELRRLQPDLPVILMSGHAEPPAAGCGTDLRASGFLTKPFPFAQLRDLMGRMFAGS